MHEMHENFWQAVLMNRCFPGFSCTKSELFVQEKQRKQTLQQRHLPELLLVPGMLLLSFRVFRVFRGSESGNQIKRFFPEPSPQQII